MFDDSDFCFPTPPVEGDINNQNESLDYMDFFFKPNCPSSSKKIDNIHESNITFDKKTDFIFECNGIPSTDGSVCGENFLSTGAFKKLIVNKFPLTSLPQTFTANFQPQNIYLKLKDQLSKLRFKTHLIEEKLGPFAPGRTSTNFSSPLELRKEIISFFAHLSQFLDEFQHWLDETFFEEVANEILSYLWHIGPLENLGLHITNASSPQGNQCSSGAYHFFHLHLDVRWWSLAILTQLERLSLNLAPLDETSPFIIQEGTAEQERQSYTQCCFTFVVWDLFTLLERQISKFDIPEYERIPPFSCSCAFELAVCLLHLLDQRCIEGFWGTFTKRLLLLLKVKFSSEEISSNSVKSLNSSTIYVPSIPVYKLTLPQIWWIFMKLSRLYLFDMEGNSVSPQTMLIKPEPKLLKTFIKLTLKPPLEELELRFYLSSCLSIMKLWSFGQQRISDWVTPIWDFISKEINSSFLLKSSGLDGFACLSKSPSDWIEKLTSLDSPYAENSENSWFIFLRILVNITKKDNEWKSMKGRIYSKFHEKKMSELTQIGLHNTISLFLTLAIAGQTQAICSKLKELLDAVPPASVGKKKVVLLGLLSMGCLLSSKSYDAKEISLKLSKEVSLVAHDFSSAPDIFVKREFGSLIVLYCEGVQDIIRSSSDINSFQNSLFCSELGYFLSNGSTSESKAVLTLIDFSLELLLKESRSLRFLAGNGGANILEEIWKNFGNQLKEARLSNSFPTLLGSIYCSLIVCSSRLFRVSESCYKSMADKASRLFLDLLSSEVISNLVCCKCIGNLMKETDSIDILACLCPKYEAKLFSFLLACIIQLGSSEEVIVLSEKVFQLPSLKEWIPVVPPCPFGATKLLIKILSERLNEADLKNRLSIRERAFEYFSPMSKFLSNFLKRTPFPSHLTEVFDLVGYFFEVGHTLFYIKGKPTCPIAELLSSVLLPTSIYSDKPLNSLLLDALEPVLPKVLEGLANLWLASDSFIKRTMKDILANYLCRYSVPSHPFLVYFNKRGTEDIRLVFVEIIRDSFLLDRRKSQIHLQLALKLLKNAVASDVDEWILPVSKLVFYPTLEWLLRVDDFQTKRCLTNLLESLLSENTLSHYPEIRSSMISSIHTFVKSQLSWYPGKVFPILEVLGCFNRRLVLDSIDGIAEAVKITEEKRGSGIDQNLRNGYRSLEKSLQKQNKS